MKRHVLVLDVGTTGAKAFVFDNRLRIIAKAYETYPVRSPRRGWVEQDPVRILRASERVMRDAVLKSAVSAKGIDAFGLTNQRETTVLWDANTMRPVAPAIVWEDSRTARRCARLDRKRKKEIREKTGLTADAYFSASKIEWMLHHVPSAPLLADVGRLRFGTIDTWLLANLCDGAPHVTDETNAARTLLFNIRTRSWDESLCDLFGVPNRILPVVLPPVSEFGTLREDIVGTPIPVRAVAGDQQSSMAAVIAASPRAKRITKITYGTGTFVMQLLGSRFALHDPFFTTLVPFKRTTAYALEAKVGVSGPEVAKRLKHPARLEAYLRQLAKHVNAFLDQLPARPARVTIDGGVTQDPRLARIQSGISGIEIRTLPTTYDGTALGIATLLLTQK